MANTTPFLDLIMPGYREYRESWWSPMNQNWDTIDTWAEATELEIVNARFSKSTLADFLGVAHEITGQLKPTPEVIAARNSAIYGFQTEEPANFDLGTRISQAEWEIFFARETQENLRALSAFRAPFPQSCVLSGSKDSDGYPTWMSTSGAFVRVDGTALPVMLSIDGRLSRVRTLETIDLTGQGDGTKYIYAQYLSDWDEGKMVIDGLAVSPAVPNGTTSLDLNNNPVYFNDLTQNFWPMYLDNTFQAGDLLDVIDSTEKGKFIVKEIIESTTPGTSNQFSIIGLFPVGGVSSINYRVYDPLRCALGFDAVETPATGKVYIGEVYFEGGSIADFPDEPGVKFRPRHFKDTFVGEWRQVDISGTNGTPNLGTPLPGVLETKYRHALGSDILDIIVQASTANDGSQPVEELAIATVTSDLGISITDAKSLTRSDNMIFTAPSHALDTFDPGTSDASFTQGTFTPGSLAGTISYALGGSITGSLTGSVAMDRSVLVKWTKNHIWIKNAVIGKFFKDYSGNTLQTGYIRVIVRKRG